MSLKDFEIYKEPVSYRGGTVEVRGIAPVDVSAIMKTHLDEVNKLYSLYQNSDPVEQQKAIADSVSFALKVAHELPDLVAVLIVRACDEVESEEVIEHVKHLPFGLQVEILRKIIDLTFEESGGVKKFFDSLMMVAMQVKPSTMG